MTEKSVANSYWLFSIHTTIL